MSQKNKDVRKEDDVRVDSSLSAFAGKPPEEQAKAKHKVFFPNLDGIRFFCFFSVFLMHAFFSDNPAVSADPTYKFLRHYLFDEAHIGVNFFFVLSGFLITYLLIKEKEITNRIHIGNFYVRRILRIWPLYFFNVAFGFLIFPKLKAMFGGVPAETADPRYYLAFLSNFDVLRHGLADSSLLNVLWSVAIEEQFYLVWPLLLFVLPARHYQKLLGTIIVLSFCFRLYHYGEPMVVHMHTLACISDMAVGGMGAALVLQNQRFHSAIRELPRWSIGLLYVALFGFYLFRKEIFTGVALSIDRLVFSLFFVGIILEQNFTSRSLFKLGRHAFISNMGKYTYGLYCLHMLPLLVVTTLLAKMGMADRLWKIAFIQVPVALVLSLVAAWVSYHAFEKHVLKLKDKFAVITKS
ncbi:MAG: acyltransferase [Flaviaesturariibacter sp.]|nr:acyltransferase [Flaviaesturariibacter sp.]